jgi:chromate transporter
LKLEKLRELALLFLRLGATTFGGPAVHIAVMEEEIVRRRGWLERKEFLDLLGVTNLLPGPNSTEMAIHIGFRRAGLAGLLVAGAAFILPAAAIVLVLAWLYVRYRSIAEIEAILFGVKPVVVAVVLQALTGTALGVSEIWTLLAAGILSAVAASALRVRALALPLLAAAGPTALSTSALFLFFLKVGSVLYGSGYVLLAFLHSDLVERYRWLTESMPSPSPR